MRMRLTRWKVGFSLLSIGGIVLTLATFTSTVTMADPILDSPFLAAADGCKYHCRECGVGLHDIVVHAETNEHSSAHLETCNPGSCESHSCGETLLAAELWGRVRNGTSKDIQRMLDQHPGRIYYNSARQAVQMTCDQGTLIASLPLTLEQANGLE